MVGQGLARHGRQGTARQAKAGRGVAGKARSGTSGRGTVWHRKPEGGVLSRPHPLLRNVRKGQRLAEHDCSNARHSALLSGFEALLNEPLGVPRSETMDRSSFDTTLFLTLRLLARLGGMDDGGNFGQVLLCR